MINLLSNGDFTGGTRPHPLYANIFLPDGFELGWVDNQPFDGIDIGQIAHRPEAMLLTADMPLDPELFGPSGCTWKVFVRNPLFFWFKPVDAFNFAAGVYRVRMRVWPKIHFADGSGIYMDDPWAAEVGLSWNDGGSILWHNHFVGNLQYTGYTWQEWIVEHAGGVVQPRFYAKGKYPADNSFFFDEILLQRLGDDPEPEPEPEPAPDGLFAQMLSELRRIADAVERIAACG